MIAFKSKIGLELVIPISLILIACATLMIIEKSWVGLIIILLVAILISLIFQSIRYRIDQDKLWVECGGFKYKPIDILSIREIKKSRDPISSPAASLDRIAIICEGSKKILLSPDQKKEFVQGLLDINPNIKTDVL
jgi:hypothetical protein